MEMKILLLNVCFGVVFSQTVKTLPFWLDSNLNCTGPVRLIYKNERAVIYGQGAVESRESPRDCRLTLKTENNFEKTYFRIQIKSVEIKECTVTFTIYDGQVSQNPLDSYDCQRGKGNYDFIHTQTDTAVFELKRQSLRNIYYDVQLIVTPLVASGDLGWENDYGRDQGIYPEKFPTEAILGIVGGALGLTLIIIVVVSVRCYRKHKAKHSNGEEHKVGFSNTGISFEPKGNGSDISAATWSTDMRSTQPRSRMTHPSEDADSVFDTESVIKKRPIAADSLQRLGDTSLGHRRGFDRRVHQRLRARDTDVTYSQDNSFVSEHEDRSPKSFIEKVLTPRVRTTPRMWDVEEDTAVGDDEDDVYSDEEAESEEEAETEEEVVSEKKQDSEEEDSEEESENSEDEEKPPEYRNVIKDNIQPPQPQPQPQPYYIQPGNQFTHQQQPQYMPQYMMYPGNVSSAPNQFVPSTVPNQFVPSPVQPNVSVPASSGPSQVAPATGSQFIPVPAGRRQNTPASEDDTSQQGSDLDRQSGLPIYSYLAKRGCVPADDTQSSHGSVPPTHRQTAEPDHMAIPHLDSGVEIMRR